MHVPFCLTRCGYCDFNAYAGLDELKPRYLAALLAEAELAAPGWAGHARSSACSSAAGRRPRWRPRICARCSCTCAIGSTCADDAEVTIEANPDTVDVASLRALRDAGYDRLSMGAQSFDPAVLASLERIHQPASVRAAMTAARAAGYDNVNLDLIYGTEGETTRVVGAHAA